MRRAAVATFVLVCVAGMAHAAGLPIPPAPASWVTDTVSFLSPTRRAQLDTRLELYERTSRHQIVVWIGGSVGAAPLDDWAVKTFQAWKIGRKKLDDGIAVFVFAVDRKIDIEVGYGLEDKVPDAVASRIIREVMAPRIRAGDADGAVEAGVNSILTAIEGRPVGDPGQGRAGEPASSRQSSKPQLILYGVLLVVFLVLLAFNPRLALLFLWSILGRGGGGGGGGGGGFGGGGGRSGGGGARGSW